MLQPPIFDYKILIHNETCIVFGPVQMAARAEDKDNLAEQTRQHGKRVRYGEVVQLKHLFSRKFVHMNTTQTSQKDKNNMKVHEYEHQLDHKEGTK